MCPGPSIMTCTSFAQARAVSSPSVSSSANCARSFASARLPGRSASPSDSVTSYLRAISRRSEEHTSELQSQSNLVCRLLLEKKQRRLQQLFIYRRLNRQLPAAD